MSRITPLIEKYRITIETSPTLYQTRLQHPTPYTLRYGNQSLRGETLTQKTITVEQALHGRLTVAGQKDVPGMERTARQAEKQLRKLLGRQFDEFSRAWWADELEARQRQRQYRQ